MSARKRRAEPRWLKNLERKPAWRGFAALVAGLLALGALVGVPQQVADAWTTFRGDSGVSTADLDTLNTTVDVRAFLQVLGPEDRKDYRSVEALDPAANDRGSRQQQWLRYVWDTNPGFTVISLVSPSGTVMAYRLQTYSKAVAPRIEQLDGRLGRSRFADLVASPEDTGTTLSLSSRDAEVYANTTAPYYEEVYTITNPLWITVALSQGGEALNDEHAVGNLVVGSPTIADLVYGPEGDSVPCGFGSGCSNKPSDALKEFRANNAPDALTVIADNVDQESALTAIKY